MIDQEEKGVMQKGQEASARCLQSKVIPNNQQDKGSTIRGCPTFNVEIKLPQVLVADGENLLSRDFSPANDNYQRSMRQQEFCMRSTFHPDIHVMQQNQWHINPFDHFHPLNREYAVPMETIFHCVPYKMFSLFHQHDFQFQEFQYFVVIDFEATCDKEKNPNPQEIIEFPSVLVNSVTGQLEASFQTYVRPIYHQLLSDFCKELTGIQQIQVDRGVSLSDALLMHDKWLEQKGIKHTNFAVVTWSNWDCRVMLESECKLKRIRKPPYFNRWINLKIPFHEVFGGIRCNLKEAVQLAGLTWEGRAHCGLDDARNTARLLTHLMHRGFRFSITNSLICQPPEDQPANFQQLPNRPFSHITHHNIPKNPFPSPVQLHHSIADPAGKDWHNPYCYCGARSSKRMVRKPGPKHGSFFFGCGNWTATRGSRCPYFEWAS